MLRAAKAALSAFWERTHRGWSQPTFGALVWAIDSRSLFNSAFGKNKIMMGMAKLVYTEQVCHVLFVCVGVWHACFIVSRFRSSGTAQLPIWYMAEFSYLYWQRDVIGRHIKGGQGLKSPVPPIWPTLSSLHTTLTAIDSTVKLLAAHCPRSDRSARFFGCLEEK